MTAAARNLVIVDDEPGICRMVADFFGRDGFSVTTCGSAPELDRSLAEAEPDLVLLDVSLPGEDGLSIARRLRAAGGTPIIMLTSHDHVVDRVVGLEVGADDYLPKPFDLHELRARVRAVLRRSAPAAVRTDARHAPGLVSFGKVSLDLEAQALVGADGTRQPLTGTEFALLEAFARNPNRVLTRERLLDSTPGRTLEVFDRSVDLRVTRVRRKVEVDPSRPQVIRTVHGTGYIFVPPEARQRGAAAR
jgi:DNA-binding response OmpR family regulator